MGCLLNNRTRHHCRPLNMTLVDASDFVHLLVASTLIQELAIRFQSLTSLPSDEVRGALCSTQSLVPVFTRVFIERRCCCELARVALFRTHGVSQPRPTTSTRTSSRRPRCVVTALMFHLHYSLQAHISTNTLPCQASSNALAF
jgi:hypothetical protein